MLTRFHSSARIFSASGVGKGCGTNSEEKRSQEDDQHSGMIRGGRMADWAFFGVRGGGDNEKKGKDDFLAYENGDLFMVNND